MKQQDISNIKKVTWHSVIANIGLTTIKLIFGLLGRSQAVIADALHSFSDLITDFAILFGVKFWSTPPDAKHPYGHKRIETVITLFISIMLFIAAFGIGYKAVITITEKHFYEVNYLALIGVLFSIFIKELLYRMAVNVGKKEKCPAVLANAWHHRTDSLSSIVVAISVIVVMINPKLIYIDNVGSIIVSFFILYTAGIIFKDSFLEIIETGVSEEYKNKISEIILASNGVESFHALRSRTVGLFWYLDVRIQVDSDITVKQGHEIASNLKQNLIEKLEDIADVVVHIEPVSND
jgi:cation diffusion facilitator family transporter